MMPVFSLYVSLRRCVQALTGLVYGSLFALDPKGVPFAVAGPGVL